MPVIILWYISESIPTQHPKNPAIIINKYATNPMDELNNAKFTKNVFI